MQGGHRPPFYSLRRLKPAATKAFACVEPAPSPALEPPRAAVLHFPSRSQVTLVKAIVLSSLAWPASLWRGGPPCPPPLMVGRAHPTFLFLQLHHRHPGVVIGVEFLHRAVALQVLPDRLFQAAGAQPVDDVHPFRAVQYR